MALGRDTNRSTGMWIPAPPENMGFLRQEASLFVIFVSDEDDSTFGQTAYFYRAFETLKGAGNESAVSMSAIVGDPDVDGVMGANPGGCPAPPEVQDARPGGRYVSLAMYSRSLSSELRVCDDKRLVCPSGQSCQKKIDGLPGVCLPAGACQVDQDCGSFQCSDPAENCIKCAENACSLTPQRFLDLLGQTGIYGSICTPNYDVVLSKLGFEAAGLSRKFLITKNADCTEKVKCCADGVPDDMCTMTETICVKVAGQPVPNDRDNGWVYEPSANAIFFDGNFVPPTDAPITISYRLTTATTPVSCTSALK